jgi:hypothetical protein
LTGRLGLTRRSGSRHRVDTDPAPARRTVCSPNGASPRAVDENRRQGQIFSAWYAVNMLSNRRNAAESRLRFDIGVDEGVELVPKLRALSTELLFNAAPNVFPFPKQGQARNRRKSDRPELATAFPTHPHGRGHLEIVFPTRPRLLPWREIGCRPCARLVPGPGNRSGVSLDRTPVLEMAIPTRPGDNSDLEIAIPTLRRTGANADSKIQGDIGWCGRRLQGFAARGGMS